MFQSKAVSVQLIDHVVDLLHCIAKGPFVKVTLASQCICSDSIFPKMLEVARQALIFGCIDPTKCLPSREAFGQLKLEENCRNRTQIMPSHHSAPDTIGMSPPRMKIHACDGKFHASKWGNCANPGSCGLHFCTVIEV